MQPQASLASAQSILPLRTRHRQEMSCQIVHDSIHRREGWTLRRIARTLGKPIFPRSHLAASAEMDDEMRSHIELQARANIEAGMNPEEARFAALRRFGWTESIKEDCREQRELPWLESVFQDIYFGVRQLRKNPGFTAIAAITLALGIGANTAIFSMIDGILLRPLPYREPNRLVTVCETNLKRGYPQIVVAPANLRDWRAQNSVFEELGGQIYTSLTLTGVEKPEHIHAAFTTPNYFSVFGVPPILGRTFVSSDDPPGHRVVVLSHGMWRRSFGSDRNIVGMSITLSGLPYTVVGVMPPEFKIYQPSGVFGLPTGDVQPQLWAPYPGPMTEQTNKFFLGFARLKPGVTTAQAQSELSAIVQRAQQESPQQKDSGASVQPLNEQIIGGTRPALRLLLGAVGFVLLIGCANVTNLSLARSAARANEFSIRSALGASRWRLARQMLIESLMLALIGGALGLLFAHWGMGALMALQPANLPRIEEIRLNTRVLGYTLVISVLAGVAFGIAPAIYSARTSLGESLKGAGRNPCGGSSPQHGRHFLLVAEVALAMILLSGAGLMINSFARLTRVDPGFRPDQLMTFDISPPYRAYAEESRRMSLVKQLRDRIQAQPGSESVATIYGLPFGTMLNSLVGVTIQGQSSLTSQERVSAGWRAVSPNYFETIGASLLLGRTFSEEVDVAGSAPVALINEAFQRKYFPTDNPVGRRIKPITISSNWHEIVGVVRDVKLTGLDAAVPPEIYQSDSQNAVWMFSLVVRSSLPAGQVEKMVRAEAAAVDKDLPLFNVRTMEQAISTSVAPRRFTVMLTTLFAALALLLTAVGIYGVVSYSVGQRTREIGIRMALGAPPQAILALFLRRGLLVALIGVGLGLAGSFAVTRLIAHQLFGVTATDPVTFSLATGLLLLVILAACFIPARRATEVDPLVALSAE